VHFALTRPLHEAIAEPRCGQASTSPIAVTTTNGSSTLRPRSTLIYLILRDSAEYGETSPPDEPMGASRGFGLFRRRDVTVVIVIIWLVVGAVWLFRAIRWILRNCHQRSPLKQILTW
jgi:hypothetical protein